MKNIWNQSHWWGKACYIFILITNPLLAIAVLLLGMYLEKEKII